MCLTSLGCANLGQVRATQPTFTWSSEEQSLKVGHFLGEIASRDQRPVVTFECRRFVPATGDKIDLEWRAGDTVTVFKRPPYAIVSPRQNIFLAPLNLGQV